MFTYDRQGICPVRFSMGKGYVAPSIHHPITSQTFINIWVVSGYHDLLRTYCPLSILVDIQHLLSSNDPAVEISDDDTLAIDRRLNDFLLQFQV